MLLPPGRRRSSLNKDRLDFTPVQSHRRGGAPSAAAGTGLPVAQSRRSTVKFLPASLAMPAPLINPDEPKLIVRSKAAPAPVRPTMHSAYEEAFDTEGSKVTREASASWFEFIKIAIQGKA